MNSNDNLSFCKTVFLALFFLTVFSATSSANNITGVCGTLGTVGENYTLNQSVSINGATCFTVSATNITLNCNGSSITGDSTVATYGVLSGQINTFVMNCTVSNFAVAVYLSGVNAKIQNSSLRSTTSYTVQLQGANESISDSNLTCTTGYCLGLYARNATVNRVNVSGGAIALYMRATFFSTINNSNFSTTGTSSTITMDSSTNGNVIDNSDITNTYNAANVYAVQIGGGETPYNNTIQNSRITALSASGITLSAANQGNNSIINTSIRVGNNGIVITAGSNQLIDCKGASITGSNTSNTYAILR